MPLRSPRHHQRRGDDLRLQTGNRSGQFAVETIETFARKVDRGHGVHVRHERLPQGRLLERFAKVRIV